GLPDAALKRGVSPQDEPEHRRGDKQEGKQREKRVVGDDRGQVAPVVLGVLPPDSERKADHAPASLKAVEPPDQLAESHRSSLRRSPIGFESSVARSNSSDVQGTEVSREGASVEKADRLRTAFWLRILARQATR